MQDQIAVARAQPGRKVATCRWSARASRVVVAELAVPRVSRAVLWIAAPGWDSLVSIVAKSLLGCCQFRPSLLG